MYVELTQFEIQNRIYVSDFLEPVWFTFVQV